MARAAKHTAFKQLNYMVKRLFTQQNTRLKMHMQQQEATE
jgi:hypothetical protein